jgi:hypothetical protein
MKTKDKLKSAIEQEAKNYVKLSCVRYDDERAFIIGALSKSTENYHKHGMYSEEDLKNCWEAADTYREECERIFTGRSNYVVPNTPDFDKWFKTIKKE